MSVPKGKATPDAKMEKTHYRFLITEDGDYPEDARQYSVPMNSPEFLKYKDFLMNDTDAWVQAYKKVESMREVEKKSGKYLTRVEEKESFWRLMNEVGPQFNEEELLEAIKKFQVAKDSYDIIKVEAYELVVVRSLILPSYTKEELNKF